MTVNELKEFCEQMIIGGSGEKPIIGTLTEEHTIMNIVGHYHPPYTHIKIGIHREDDHHD